MAYCGSGRSCTLPRWGIGAGDRGERPGALTNFLDSLGSGWNVTLFHYRNHGADFGRVLVGLQVPPAEMTQLQSFLDTLGYVYHPETDNEVYKQFLR